MRKNCDEDLISSKPEKFYFLRDESSHLDAYLVKQT